MVEQMLMVLLVLGGLVALLWLLRRRGMAQVRFAGRKRTASRQLELLERMPLTATHSLHLVRAGNSVLLVGVSPSSCQAIATLPAAEAQKAAESVLSWEGS